MRFKINSDRLMSVSAMVVGIGSLFTVIYQTALTREAQHASVLPYLMIQLNSNDQGGYLTVSNTGIGPAVIQDVRIRYRGEQILKDPYDFYVDLRHDSTVDVNRVMAGRLIPAGASIPMIGVPGQARRGAFVAEILRLFQIAEVPRSWYASVGALGGDKAVLEITYATGYGQRFRVRSDRMVPERL